MHSLKKFIDIEFPITIWLKIFFSSAIFSIIIIILKRVLVMNYILEAAICLCIASIAFITCLYILKVISLNHIMYLKKIL
jgi:hypothetical protein